MEWVEAFKLAGAFAVPLVAVATLFYGMMRVSLGKIENELSAIKDNVHALDVRMARLEERIPNKS